MDSVFGRWGAFFMFAAVALGAFGAHALKGRLSPESAAVYETAVRYQIYHALALFVVAWILQTVPQRWAIWAGYSFVTGIFLFSGSLYALTFTNISKLGAITPFGGLLFLAGWVFVFLSLKR